MFEKWVRVFSALGCLAFLVLWLWDPVYSEDQTKQLLLKSVVFHGVGVLIFIPLLLHCKYHVWRIPKARQMLLCLPALLVAVNNFPFFAVILGNVTVERTDLIPLYLLNCVFIGAFEEIAFRGTLFLLLLENKRQTKRQIFWATVCSSAIFGLFHLSNLLEGASVGATLLQVGYSFLIGGMCAIVLLKTGNLVFPILLHGVYDLGGTFLSSGVAAGRMWDLPTVIWTAVLGIFTFVWMTFQLYFMTPDEVGKLY